MEEESQQGFLDAWGKERGKLWVCFWGGGRGRERERKREKERGRERERLLGPSSRGCVSGGLEGRKISIE